jgi:hypothetical protein
MRGLFEAAGASYPIWTARAGKIITVRNLSPTNAGLVDKVRTIRLKRTEYQVDEDILIPSPEFEPPKVSDLVGMLMVEGVVEVLPVPWIRFGGAANKPVLQGYIVKNQFVYLTFRDCP